MTPTSFKLPLTPPNSPSQVESETKPHEKATWIFRTGEEKQHIWLAEQSGWEILQVNEDSTNGKVIIQAIRILKEWPKTHFGD